MCSYMPSPVSGDTERIRSGMQRSSCSVSKCRRISANVAPSSSVIVASTASADAL
jgi:hypothetical protein